MALVGFGLALLCLAGSAQAQIAIFSDRPESAARIFIDRQLQWTDSLSDARVLVIARPFEDAAQLEAALAGAARGSVLFLFLDRGQGILSPDGLRLQVAAEVGQRKSIEYTGVLDSAWARSVNWGSAPALERYARFRLGGEDERQVVLRTLEEGDPLLSRIPWGEGEVILLPYPMPSPEDNSEMLGWPYYRYLMQALAAEALGVAAVEFSSWDQSPLPDSRAGGVMAAAVALLGLLTLAAFVLQRRNRTPEAALEAYSGPAEGGIAKLWREPGFERPLSGFLFLLGISLLLFIPTFYYSNVLFINEIVPSPQALGMDRWVFWFFAFFWLFFDWGSSESMVKHFSQYFSTDRARAFRHLNFFVWWQISTGFLQLAAVLAAAILLLPRSSHAYLVWIFLFHALRQYPGLFYVREDQQPLFPQSLFSIFFRALQRFDLEQTLRLYSVFVVVGCQIGGILLARRWGAAHPQYGEVMAMAAGIPLSSFAAYALCFALGAWICRRSGYPLGPIFSADFDLKTARQSLSLGGRVFAGHGAFQFGELAQTLILSTLLLRYTELLGIWFYMLSFAVLYHTAKPYADSLAPSVAQAIALKRRGLFEYTIASGLRYGTLYGLTAAAVLAAASRPFVLHFADPQWHRAADILPVFALWGYLIPPSHVAASVLLGAGRPGLHSLTVVVEQSFRLGLMIVLIPRLQFWGIILSYLFPIIAKNILAWWMVRRLVVRFRFYWWPAAAAPSLAALANALILLAWGAWYWTMPAPWNAVFFCINLTIVFPAAFFFNGLFGGWDAEGLRELDKAARMSGAMRWISSILTLCARSGAGLSPLRRRGAMPRLSFGPQPDALERRAQPEP